MSNIFIANNKDTRRTSFELVNVCWQQTFQQMVNDFNIRIYY